MYLLVRCAVAVIAYSTAFTICALFWNARMYPPPSARGRWFARLVCCAMMAFLATTAAISIPRYLGLLLPPRQVDGVVTGLYTKKYGAKYQENDNTLDYAVIGGRSYLLNNDRSPYDLRVGDHVRCQYHAGMNEIVQVHWVYPEGTVKDRPPWWHERER